MGNMSLMFFTLLPDASECRGPGEVLVRQLAWPLALQTSSTKMSHPRCPTTSRRLMPPLTLLLYNSTTSSSLCRSKSLLRIKIEGSLQGYSITNVAVHLGQHAMVQPWKSLDR
eukprot:jgi/Botrbrau1/10290/Bobra.0120s0012.1